MKMKKIEIDGGRFNNLKEFYDEVERCLTDGLDWEIGQNLDALDDVLQGGFGIHDYKEEIELTWLNSERSKLKLGFAETVKYIQMKLGNCHPTNRQEVREDLELAKNEKGETLFEMIVEIIKAHEHIKLKMQ